MLIVRWLLVALCIFYAVKKKTIPSWIFAMLIAGIVFGIDFPSAASNLKVLGDIFLRLIKTIIAPLIFGTLISGIIGHTNLKQVGRIGLKAIIYFEVITTFALIIGLAAINISQAGAGITLPAEATTSALPANENAGDFISHIFPENIAKAIADGQVLQIVVFTILFAIAISFTKPEIKNRWLTFAGDLSEIMFRFTNIVMYFAPVAVFGSMSYTIARYGLGIFGNLIKLLFTLYIALIVFIVLVFIPVLLIFRISVQKFFKAVSEPFILAFATASSESALPIAMEKMEELGVPRSIASLIIPLGYSFNLDGSTLYLSLASVFVAQAAGLHFPIGQQILLMLTLMLTSKGVAGVPRASLVILSATVASFNLPSAPVIMLIGIDALMDMARTSVNVMGNCLASVVIAKSERQFQTK